MTVADLGEDALIRLITADLPAAPDVLTGIGDDCAVVRASGRERGWSQLLKTDCVIQGVHFLAETPAQQVGWKAMARVISDIAAMAGEPAHALVTLVLPPATLVTYVQDLYAGLEHCASAYGVHIVGGETSRGPVTMISISMTGRVRTRDCVRRDAARPGDAICVTGVLGGTIHEHHLTFRPRLKEAHWLAKHCRPRAMMDLSDGLAKDIHRLDHRAAPHGYVIWPESLPLRAGCTPEQALGDGEDYELLVIIPWKKRLPLLKAWQTQFPETPLTVVGRFLLPGEAKPPEAQTPLGGWDHFRA